MDQTEANRAIALLFWLTAPKNPFKTQILTEHEHRTRRGLAQQEQKLHHGHHGELNGDRAQSARSR